MHCLVATPSGFDLHTDYNNLIFLLDPLSVVPDMTQTSLHKVLRYAVRMSVYNYTCVHIRGTDNVWSDLLTRFSAPSTVRRILHIPVLSSSSHLDFDWLTQEFVENSQSTYAEEHPKNLKLK